MSNCPNFEIFWTSSKIWRKAIKKSWKVSSMGKQRPILYAIEKCSKLHGKTMYNFFLDFIIKKKGQIYFDPKARWDKTALKVSKVSNRQYNWPNSRKQLPTQNHRINQNLKVVHGLSMKFWAFLNSVQNRSWFTHVPYHFRMEFSVSDHCATSRRGAAAHRAQQEARKFFL